MHTHELKLVFLGRAKKKKKPRSPHYVLHSFLREKYLLLYNHFDDYNFTIFMSCTSQNCFFIVLFTALKMYMAWYLRTLQALPCVSYLIPSVVRLALLSDSHIELQLYTSLFFFYKPKSYYLSFKFYLFPSLSNSSPYYFLNS